MTADADYLAALEAWKTERLAKLKAPNGWLNIIGRYWLNHGPATVGSAANNDIVLSAGPARVGTITQDDSGVTFTPADGGETIRLKLDKKHPPQFTVGPLLLEVTSLNGDNALRVRDTESAAPAAFPGIDYFDVEARVAHRRRLGAATKSRAA